ncbi:LOW QUALITY PROTEIN: hypothetical protein Cgig2_030693 [Carnegiea gigantea]|uniref:Protein kinase domain-containing protein n=1 Tax=Carnegiea gigantea TaxID=171969 RepID=A0A9Q1GSU1_9CARY|nr:LOW QUALITY PROTEIN: hypothetical protein Cgig2_030693 [Carnegiea gigantea]
MLPLIAIILWLSAKEASAGGPPMAKPGCPDKCGNVTVSFPFGIGSNCYYNDWYSITCNDSTPVLAKFDLEVLGITLGEGQFSYGYQLHCGKHHMTSTNLGGSPYSYSDIYNVFVPVLCPATSLSNGQDKIVAQCAPTCDFNSRYMSSFTSEEICETHPPLSLSVYDVNIARSNGTCSYIFMVDIDDMDMSYVSQSQRSVLHIKWDFVHGDDYTQVTCFRSTRSKAHLLPVILGLSVGFGSLFSAVVCYWLWRFLRKRKQSTQRAKHFKRNGGILLQQQMSSNDGVVEKTKLFTIKELEAATDHFNQNRILGRGGQGTVYKGMLIDGRIIAVKKSKNVDESQLEPFINQVVILSQINHRNVVKLLGCCLETEVPLLVYEFIPNGTLARHIHNPSEELHISWKMRLQIAAESAGAIAYLHSSSSTPIYQRDIKSSNILLDDKYRAKVSDFGTSRTITIDQTHLTTQVQGTFGYLDPEYFQTNQFTEKSDVYSFGVVLGELLTSKKRISPDKSKKWRSLTTEFLYMIQNSWLSEILDPQVLKEGKQEEIMAMANLAKDCLNLNGKQRPTMKAVAMVLEGLITQSGTSSIQQASPDWNNVAPDVSEVDVEGPFSSSTFSSACDGNSCIVNV